MRRFDTGSTRDTDDGKYEYLGFLSPKVLERYAQYMHLHRQQADGNMRSSDNWKKGMPTDVYAQSLGRHFMEWWKDYENGEINQEALCALLFNVFGLLYEELK